MTDTTEPHPVLGTTIFHTIVRRFQHRKLYRFAYMRITHTDDGKIGLMYFGIPRPGTFDTYEEMGKYLDWEKGVALGTNDV